MISNNLFCFKSPKEPAALAEILIEQHSIIATLRDAPFRFEIQTNDKYFTLEAASTPNLALWIDSLEKVKQQYHEPTDDEYVRPFLPSLSFLPSFPTSSPLHFSVLYLPPLSLSLLLLFLNPCPFIHSARMHCNDDREYHPSIPFNT